MATIILTSMLADQFTDGQRRLQLDVASVRRLYERLDQLYPGLGTEIADNGMLSIDGQLQQSPFLAVLSVDAEVHVFPRIAAG